MNKQKRQLRRAVEILIHGLENNDIALIGKMYAHNPNLLVFLEGPKMKLVGWKAMKKAITNFLRVHTDIQSRLNKDCRFIASGDLGVFYGTYRFKARNKKTNKLIQWTARNTFVFRKRKNKWEIIHEHDSFPVQMT